ncbi:hypothetical protein BC936DRAFT_141901 [Jimgerdemannia flammicorona]|uniref:Uncharacterized protein n=1 Tax=Jimgerdemannia flammicorona TaxID=994334 RepID=A0A433A1F7_9FUNG|nr:hypothetical protein BC936DRAFT_141901 [Jimgerdemannia flammicorona]
MTGEVDNTTLTGPHVGSRVAGGGHDGPWTQEQGRWGRGAEARIRCFGVSPASYGAHSTSIVYVLLASLARWLLYIFFLFNVSITEMMLAFVCYLVQDGGARR